MKREMILTTPSGAIDDRGQSDPSVFLRLIKVTTQLRWRRFVRGLSLFGRFDTAKRVGRGTETHKHRNRRRSDTAAIGDMATLMADIITPMRALAECSGSITPPHPPRERRMERSA